ncbi:hypothetical protein K2173_016867 [Erythroxylum novogranatense]|uniref:AATF leucine zipper-containing domain-containing protein n=1 Tax=Erythroxylum novogranatense TaxID=1862640 RepID=A0AAV8U699_9ROSI|nr:hypothetical protein K2173_016867 [Erythroxylum novogranatense]
MGFSGKRSRGTRDIDGDFEDEFDSTANGNVAVSELHVCDLLKNLKRHKDEDVLKGQAVKNQKALIEKNPAISESSNGKSAQPSKKHPNDSEDIDEEWLRISQTNRRIVGFRDKSLDKWQRKAQVTTGAAAIKNKLQAFNQNISEQVAAYMRDPSRMDNRIVALRFPISKI